MARSVRSDGFCLLAAVLADRSLAQLHATECGIDQIVLKHGKGRFALRVDGASGLRFIRALAGSTGFRPAWLAAFRPLPPTAPAAGKDQGCSAAAQEQVQQQQVTPPRPPPRPPPGRSCQANLASGTPVSPFPVSSPPAPLITHPAPQVREARRQPAVVQPVETVVPPPLW